MGSDLRLWTTSETLADIIARQALHTRLQEDDIAAAVLFLATADNRMIIKQHLIVGAGLR